MVLLVGCGSVEDRGCIQVDPDDFMSFCDNADYYEIMESKTVMCTYECGIDPNTGNCGTYTIRRIYISDNLSEFSYSIPLETNYDCYLK